MRKFALGAVPTRGSWTPKFLLTPRKEKTKDKSKEGTEGQEPEERERKAPTQVPTYHPPAKGKLRYERLRNYYHGDAAFLLDAWYEVQAWTAATTSIPVTWDLGDFDYLPDFLVQESSHSYALSITHPLVKETDRRKARLDAIRAACARRSLGFEAMTYEELSGHAELPAAKDLFYYRYWAWPASLPFSAWSAYEHDAPRTLGELARLLGDGATWEQLLSLAANGYLVIDISEGLGTGTALLACRTKGWRT
jgi:hypothetical protein